MIVREKADDEDDLNLSCCQLPARLICSQAPSGTRLWEGMSEPSIRLTK